MSALKWSCSVCHRICSPKSQRSSVPEIDDLTFVICSNCWMHLGLHVKTTIYAIQRCKRGHPFAWDESRQELICLRCHTRIPLASLPRIKFEK